VKTHKNKYSILNKKTGPNKTCTKINLEQSILVYRQELMNINGTQCIIQRSDYLSRHHRTDTVKCWKGMSRLAEDQTSTSAIADSHTLLATVVLRHIVWA